MQLFSRRYTPLRLRGFTYYDPSDGEKNNFLQERMRKRLQFEIKFLVETGEFMEDFLMAKDVSNERFFLYSVTLRNLSVSELGYDITQILDCNRVEFLSEQYTDMMFFDLVELIIIFSKKEKRPDIIERISRIFEEEGNEFMINGYMIVYKRETGLRALIPLVKEQILREKLEKFYELQRVRPNYDNLSRISADIVQYVFSSPSKKSTTKSYTEDLCKKVASKWTDTVDIGALSSLLNSQAKLSKDFNNQISNIRHTDRLTIPVEGESLYKLITMNNISLVELIIQSLPGEYIVTKNPDEEKEEYLSKYKLSGHSWWEIPVPMTPEEIADDIPF